MFKKGMKPHNRGSEYVDEHYRAKPKKDKDDYGMGYDMSKLTGYDSKKYNEMLYKKFFGNMGRY